MCTIVSSHIYICPLINIYIYTHIHTLRLFAFYKPRGLLVSHAETGDEPNVFKMIQEKYNEGGSTSQQVCACVCVRERVRERERVKVCV
jgi:hypothetical protein